MQVVEQILEMPLIRLLLALVFLYFLFFINILFNEAQGQTTPTLNIQIITNLNDVPTIYLNLLIYFLVLMMDFILI
jgi:hypothetical protein